jgi:hypothetical protein
LPKTQVVQNELAKSLFFIVRARAQMPFFGEENLVDKIEKTKS